MRDDDTMNGIRVQLEHFLSTRYANAEFRFGAEEPWTTGRELLALGLDRLGDTEIRVLADDVLAVVDPEGQ
jgi:hypothetical protein